MSDMVKDPEIADKILIQTIGSTISRMTLFICCVIGFGMMLSTCSVDKDVISQCDEACGIRGIKEVTSTSCECNNMSEPSAADWVITK